jgi:two-component system, response regulator FlrC
MIKPTGGSKAVAESLATDPQPAADYLAHVREQQQRSLGQVALLAADEKMARIKETIEQISGASVPVLLTGESGTGKEILARQIHQCSSRASQPFVAVNCAALPSTLLESELFGHEKGSFTGAHQRHVGKFEQASGGTLLLDEVTEMDPALQAKLLRALQEKEIERIGGTGPIRVDTRIIATTNRNIAQAVAQGQFRQDLYYRLDVIKFEVPPLRERPKDIEMLAWHFLRQFCEQAGKSIMELTPEARAKLRQHSWPGNVRELQNVIQRTVLLTSGNAVNAVDLPIEGAGSGLGGIAGDWIAHLPIGRPLRDLETQFILETLKHHQGNRTHAARTLGISLRTLRNKINEFTAEGLEVMAPVSGRAS